MEQTFKTTFEREIKAPVEKIWQAWANAKQWSSWIFLNMQNDFTTGGKFDNGKGEGGEYLEIVPNEKIKFTWEMKRYQPGSIVEIHLAPAGKGTLFTLTHFNLQTQNDAHDAALGWNWGIYSLQCFVESGTPVSWEEWENKTVAS